MIPIRATAIRPATFGDCQNDGGAGLGLILAVLMGLASGLSAVLLWGAFLILLIWSVFMLLTTGLWPERPINFYQALMDAPLREPFGSFWIGWYLLLGAAVATLVTAGMSAVAHDEASKR